MSKLSLTNQAGAIREYLTRLMQGDPTAIYQYRGTAAQWEALRLSLITVRRRPADYRWFRDLSDLLRRLMTKLGLLETATEENHGPDAMPGLTSYTGHLPLELGESLGDSCDESASGR